MLDPRYENFSGQMRRTRGARIRLGYLSPDFRSLMDELLSRKTMMRVRQAEHDLAIEPNTVYLLPPMKEMIIRQRRLLLSDKDPRHGLTLPIDLFFRSLAQDAGTRAIGVVLFCICVIFAFGYKRTLMRHD